MYDSDKWHIATSWTTKCLRFSILRSSYIMNWLRTELLPILEQKCENKDPVFVAIIIAQCIVYLSNVKHGVSLYREQIVIFFFVVIVIARGKGDWRKLPRAGMSLNIVQWTNLKPWFETIYPPASFSCASHSFSWSLQEPESRWLVVGRWEEHSDGRCSAKGLILISLKEPSLKHHQQQWNHHHP